MIQAIGVIIGLYGIWLRFSNSANRAIPYCLVSGIVLLCVGSAMAHDHSRPELNDWFNGLASKQGPCCSIADGETVADVDWQTRDGHYIVRLGNDWIEVDDSAVITEPNRDGRTMVWPFKSVGGETMVRCFMPGMMS